MRGISAELKKAYVLYISSVLILLYMRGISAELKKAYVSAYYSICVRMPAI